MPRDYAQIVTAIWRNAEFKALDEGPQRLYLLLTTQSDISAAGVLALRVRRWADMAANSTPDRIMQALKTLEEGRFVVVDHDTEELLIRSFIKWDKGYRNSKRRPAIARALDDVASAVIFMTITAELDRLGVTLPRNTPRGHPANDLSSAEPALSHAVPDSLSGTASRSLDATESGHETVTERAAEINSPDTPQTAFPQVNTLSDRASPSEGVVVTYWSKDTTTHNPAKTSTPTASRAATAAEPADDRPEPDEPTAQTLIREWIDSRRKRPPGAVIGHTAKTVKAMLEEGITANDIRAGLHAWADKGLHPAALPAVVNEIMNSAPTHRTAGRPRKPNADDKIRALRALTEQLDATRDNQAHRLPSAKKEQK